MAAVTDTDSSVIVRTRIGVLTYLAPRDTQVTAPVLKALRSAAEQCMKAREFQVVIDLGAVQSVNSALLEALLDIQNELVRQGWRYRDFLPAGGTSAFVLEKPR